MIRKAYSFTARGACTTTGYGLEALCIFFHAQLPITSLEFFDELGAALIKDKQTLPDCVLIIADQAGLENLQNYWVLQASERDLFKQRGVHKNLPFVKSYHFASWTPHAGLNVTYVDFASPSYAFSLPLESFVQQGLETLAVSNSVVQIAPAGHVFKHPSSTVNKLFIQARELATSEAELAFAGRCLARSLAALQDPKLMQVYIDSMGIYSLVREALNFVSSTASIHSFHSYDKVSKLAPPTEPYVVIISASTSGGMASRLRNEQGFDGDRLVTLIDASRNDRMSEVLIALDGIESINEKQYADGTETQIELFGEHFSSKAKPPRSVILGQMHTPKNLSLYLKKFGLSGAKGLNAEGRGSGAARLVCLDSSAVANCSELVEWLDKEIAWRIPASIDHLLHAGDEGSELLAQKASKMLQQINGKNAPPTITSYSDITGQTFKNAKGVLVVQAVAGDGGLIREISRDLREYLNPDIPRHFFIAVGMPQTSETWVRLQQFLVKNASDREYGFSSWLTLPIGFDGLDSAWHAYAALAAESQLTDPHVSGIDSVVVDKSLEMAVELIDKSFNGFLATNAGNDLGLTDGFVFFGQAFEKEPLSKVPVSTAFVTVSAVLQAARDLTNPKHQLRPTGYESVVLSPENFQRFNDNLLQACILRAAYPSELDYSSSPHLSGLMKEFLLKLFVRSNHAYGAAALEFAAAIATGKLKLADKDLQFVRSKAIKNLGDKPSPLLGILCMPY